MMRIATVFGLTMTALPLLAQTPDVIIMPHDTHFEADVACADCHSDIAGSTDALSRRLPDMDVCADCHDVDDEEQCADCHTNVEEAGDYRFRAYGAALFGHRAHTERGIDCATCHDNPAAGHPVMPGKAECRACHETSDDYAGCAMCHAPDFELRPVDHDPDWIHHHGLHSRLDRDACMRCHTRSTCQECHAGDNVRPRSHDLDFAFGHALEARDHTSDCFACHADPGYCNDCHASERIMPLNHSRTDWLSLGDGGRHAEEGAFDLESCVACHDAGDAEPSCA